MMVYRLEEYIIRMPNDVFFIMPASEILFNPLKPNLFFSSENEKNHNYFIGVVHHIPRIFFVFPSMRPVAENQLVYK